MPKWAILRGRIIDIQSRGREGRRPLCLFCHDQFIFLPERYLPLTLNLSLTLDSATDLPCLWPLLTMINIKHVYTWGVRHLPLILVACQEHWWLLNIHHTQTDKSRTVGPASVPHVSTYDPVLTSGWNLWKKFSLQRQGSQKELLWLFCHHLEKKATHQDGWVKKEDRRLLPAAGTVNSEAHPAARLPFRLRL